MAWCYHYLTQCWLVRFCDTHMRPVLQDVHQILIHKMILRNALVKITSTSLRGQWVNCLCHCTCPRHSNFSLSWVQFGGKSQQQGFLCSGVKTFTCVTLVEDEVMVNFGNLLLILRFLCNLEAGKPLTHWGRVTHICISKQTIIGSDNGLSPGRRQAIIWTNAGILLIGPLETKFNEILI